MKEQIIASKETTDQSENFKKFMKKVGIMNEKVYDIHYSMYRVAVLMQKEEEWIQEMKE